MSPRPLVAVSATSDTISGRHRVRLNDVYVRVLERANLVPVIVPPLASPEAVADILGAVSGLVLTGGEDIDPARYGASAHAATGVPQTGRDDTESSLVLSARDRALPLLGICRGIQILNVALGGTLVQDLPTEKPSNVEHSGAGHERGSRTHALRVTPGSRLHQALGATDIDVNSLHHQAIDRVAQGILATAWAPDGIIEGVEASDANWWAVAVQWHPEELDRTPERWDQSLFMAFASACGEQRGTRE